MPIRNLQFRAGVIKDETELGAKPYWSDSDRIRFVRDRVQKLGGWDAYTSQILNGICRALFAWRDSNSTRRLALGTHKRLYVEEATTLFDITPIRATSDNLTDPFTTVAASPIVNVEDATHGADVGDGVIIANADAVGGITIDGAYEIVAVVDADNYQIVHSSPASSSATGGGTTKVDIQYQISIGRQDAVEGSGYGIGGYGEGTYGTVRTSSIVLPPRVWTLDAFGANLLAAVRDGSIYKWTLDTATPAALLSNAPTPNIGMFVTEEQTVVALGAGGDNMKIEWSDQGGDTVWSPAATNIAGGRQLTGGNKCLQGLRIRGSNLILTDGSVWTMTFIGGLDAYGFQQHAEGSEGGISQHCGVVVDGIAFWMGQKDFYMFDGVVKRMPRADDIKQFVFENLETTQAEKCHAFYMSQYSEIWFFYPVDAENSRYVKFNISERCWDVGGLVRTAAIDAGIFPNPIMTNADGEIWSHESGVNDNERTDLRMDEYVKSAAIEIADGEHLMEILGLYPDIKDQVGTVVVHIYTREYPNETEVESQAYGMAVDTSRVDPDPHESGRQMALKFGTVEAGTDWRLGIIKLYMQPLGRH